MCRSNKSLVVLASSALLLTWAACLLPAAESAAPDAAYAEEIRVWREKRLERLKADTGYLALAGLYWLDEGEHSFGSDRSNRFVFPASAPARAGVFVRHGATTTVRCSPGTTLQHEGKPVQEMTLVSDDAGKPTVLTLGDLSFSLIARGDRFAIRLRDKQSPIRKNFRGIESFPLDPQYRVTARFEPYEPAKKILIASVVGTADTMLSPGALVFTMHGQECRFDPVWEGPEDDSLWLIFRDATSGEETYGDGRFLYTDLPKDGKVIVDFNKAYNPPCAFSPYTTCPLPPPQNELAVPIRAGEKSYEDHATP